jgi:hypothetical protein
MIESECPRCGGRIFVLARACPACGVARQVPVAGMMVAGALTLALVAIVAALAVVLSWYQLAAATESGAPADGQIAAGSTADLSWLANAMSGCDAEAKADLAALHFLVTPLASVAKDIEPWRAKSINDAGTGILLRSDDTLDGLKNGTLRIYPADYGFAVVGQAGEAVHKWRPSLGVTKFSAADTGAFASFMVQFRTAHSGSDLDWGGSFTRLEASCHWVNVIIRD